MSKHMPAINSELLRYLRDSSLRETNVQKELRKITDDLPESGWEVAPEQAQFLALLVQITSTRKILEIGTFTGHSSLAMGLALPEDGEIVTCDMEAKYTDIAMTHWAKAGIAHKVKLLLGPALDSLSLLLNEGAAGCFDMAFIDANKKDYDAYYEAALELIRPGGLIVIDNVFWSGNVLDQENTEKSTNAIRALNKKLHKDQRVGLSMLPLNDGMTLSGNGHTSDPVYHNGVRKLSIQAQEVVCRSDKN